MPNNHLIIVQVNYFAFLVGHNQSQERQDSSDEHSDFTFQSSCQSMLSVHSQKPDLISLL